MAEFGYPKRLYILLTIQPDMDEKKTTFRDKILENCHHHSSLTSLTTSYQSGSQLRLPAVVFDVLMFVFMIVLLQMMSCCFLSLLTVDNLQLIINLIHDLHIYPSYLTSCFYIAVEFDRFTNIILPLFLLVLFLFLCLGPTFIKLIRTGVLILCQLQPLDTAKSYILITVNKAAMLYYGAEFNGEVLENKKKFPD